MEEKVDVCYSNKTRRMITAVYGITLSYTGVAIIAFTKIGQEPCSAFYYSLSQVFHVSVGTVIWIFQWVFLLGQFMIEKKNFKAYQLLHLVTSAYGSIVLDVVLYRILMPLNQVFPYIIRFIFFFIDMIFNAIGINITMHANMISLPLERFLFMLANVTGKTFGKWKQIKDILFVMVTILICIIFRLNFTIREGTVIRALFYGKLIDLTENHLEINKFKTCKICKYAKKVLTLT